MLRGEKATFQMIYSLDFKEDGNFSRYVSVKLSGELAKYTTIREVQSVPAVVNYRGTVDDDFITTEPALIPDVLALSPLAADFQPAFALSNPFG